MSDFDLHETVEVLSYEKKLAIARFALEVAAVDGEITTNEIGFINNLCSQLLGIDLGDKLDTIMEEEYKDVLSRFSMDEAKVLGVILSYLSKMDGKISNAEIEHTRSLLKQTGMEENYIDFLINFILESDS